MPGLSLPNDTRRKSVFRDQRCLTHVEQVVYADLEEMLVRMIGERTVGIAATIIAVSLGKCLRTVPDKIVFHLDGPILGEGMFNTKTEQKTIQRATFVVGIGKGLIVAFSNILAAIYARFIKI